MSDSHASPSNRPPVEKSLIERLQAELRARWQRGERGLVEDALAKHPGLAAEPERVLELIYAEVLAREQCGEAPCLEEYLLRFPQYSSQLRDQFEVHQAIELGGLRGLEVTHADRTLQGVQPKAGAALMTINMPGYEILEELGRGGMGVVYQAWQERLQRLVALKMLLGGTLAGPEERARFRTEAEAVARLEHPHIVHIHEMGEQAGQPYFALEYVDGQSLGRKMAGTPLAARAAAELVETLARAIHYAHLRGVVHRDLTPNNILLTADGKPKITDFGLAKLMVGGGPGQTRTGALLGTPSYMAPEQAGGKTREATAAVDVYALGAILYEALTGRPPFKAETPLETLRQVLADEPVPPRRLRPRLPRDLETVCLKCLQKSPARRHASAEALAEDLRRFLTGEPIRARPVGTLERALKWVHRRPAMAGLLGVIALAVMILLAAGVVFTQQLQEERDNADRESREAMKQGALAEKSRTHALGQQHLARQEKQKAQRENARYRQTLYAAHVHLAYQAWQDGHINRVVELLDGKGCPADLRAWEWHFLRGLCHKDVWTLKAHDTRVICLAFRPDGRVLASGSYDRKVRLWNLADRRLICSLTGHTGWVGSVAFSSRGRWLVSGSDDGTIRLWDPIRGRCLRKLPVAGDWVRCVVFSPDDRFLASAHRDGTVKLWDTTTWQIRRTIRGHNDLVQTLAFSPDGSLLASAGIDRSVQLWDVATGELARPIRVAHRYQISGVAFSPDGRMGDQVLGYGRQLGGSPHLGGARTPGPSGRV
jgi:hypothetical protein